MIGWLIDPSNDWLPLNIPKHCNFWFIRPEFFIFCLTESADPIFLKNRIKIKKVKLTFIFKIPADCVVPRCFKIKSGSLHTLFFSNQIKRTLITELCTSILLTATALTVRGKRCERLQGIRVDVIVLTCPIAVIKL
jgi:hypothetical protein